MISYESFKMNILFSCTNGWKKERIILEIPVRRPLQM